VNRSNFSVWEEDREPTIWKKKRKEKTGVKSRDTLEKKRKNLIQN
jgi:hypothetical protein